MEKKQRANLWKVDNSYYNPEQWFHNIRNEMRGIFDGFLENEEGRDNILTQVVRAKMDISENDKEYIFTLDIPGSNKDNTHIWVRGNHLEIQAEREKHTNTETKDHLHVIERSRGRFVRSIVLPEDADTSAVNASPKNGVLTIRVQKQRETQARKIDLA